MTVFNATAAVIVVHSRRHTGGYAVVREVSGHVTLSVDCQIVVFMIAAVGQLWRVQATVDGRRWQTGCFINRNGYGDRSEAQTAVSVALGLGQERGAVVRRFDSVYDCGAVTHGPVHLVPCSRQPYWGSET